MYASSKSPTADSRGNLVFDGRYNYQYDAWNRLTGVYHAGSDPNDPNDWGSRVYSAAYDGLGRRVEKDVAGCADWNETYRYYHTGQQVVEIRNADATPAVLTQYVWGLGYIDELVQTGVGMGSGVRNFWIMQDVNYNVMGVLSDGPASVGPRLVERYEYTPYGRRTVFSHGFLAADFNGDGTVDDADVTIYNDNSGSSGVRWFEGDGNGDGTVDSADYTVWADQYGDSVPTSAGNDPYVMQPRLESFRGYWPWGDEKPSLCDVGHQGLLYDREIDGYYNRMRMYLPRVRRFAQRDPLGYVDGMSLYQYVGGRPIGVLDWQGLEGTELLGWRLIPSVESLLALAYEHDPKFTEFMDSRLIDRLPNLPIIPRMRFSRPSWGNPAGVSVDMENIVPHILEAAGVSPDARVSDVIWPAVRLMDQWRPQWILTDRVCDESFVDPHRPPKTLFSGHADYLRVLGVGLSVEMDVHDFVHREAGPGGPEAKDVVLTIRYTLEVAPAKLFHIMSMSGQFAAHRTIQAEEGRPLEDLIPIADLDTLFPEEFSNDH